STSGRRSWYSRSSRAGSMSSPAGAGLPASGEMAIGPSGPGRCGERKGTAAAAGTHLSLRAGAGGKTDRYLGVAAGSNLGNTGCTPLYGRRPAAAGSRPTGPGVRPGNSRHGRPVPTLEGVMRMGGKAGGEPAPHLRGLAPALAVITA